MADKLFQGLITDEGIEKARDTQTTQGWYISPFEFYLSETASEFVTSRTTSSMNPTWYHSKFSAVTKQGTDKILLTITLSGDEDSIQRQIKEIYIKCKLPDGSEFLYALVQPLITMTFVPTVSQEMNFLITLSNTNKEDIYTIQYIDTTKLNSYQLKTEKGQKSGYCPLGADGTIPDDYLPLRDNLPIGTMLPLFCTKDYIPAGYLPCDGQEYTYTEFPAVYSDYLLTGKLPTCTYTEYTNSINSFGSCSKFALDTTNLKFRVPNIADGTVLQQAKSDSQLTKLDRPGLPNITGTFRDFSSADNTSSGAIRKTRDASYSWYANGGGPLDYANVDFNASRSSSLYGASSTVQPKAVSLRWFILVTHGLTNTSLTDWSAWINQLNSNTESITTLQQWDIGIPIPMVTNDLPENCIRLEGASVLISDYPKLWAKYGSTWGQVDDQHFSLPNFNNRALWGATGTGYLGAGLPNIWGKFGCDDNNLAPQGCFAHGSGVSVNVAGGGWSTQTIDFNASRSSSLYGASSTVQPPAIKVRFITRYQ